MNCDIFRLLLEAGADIACVDNEGHLPIDKAEEDDMRQLLATWMRKKGKFTRNLGFIFYRKFFKFYRIAMLCTKYIEPKCFHL